MKCLYFVEKIYCAPVDGNLVFEVRTKSKQFYFAYLYFKMIYYLKFQQRQYYTGLVKSLRTPFKFQPLKSGKPNLAIIVIRGNKCTFLVGSKVTMKNRSINIICISHNSFNEANRIKLTRFLKSLAFAKLTVSSKSYFFNQISRKTELIIFSITMFEI